MKIALTGATGHLGKIVLQQLLLTHPPQDVVALVRDARKAKLWAAQGVQVREASYDEPERLREALTGVERLLLISSSEVGKRVAQHKNVIQAAEQAGVQYLAYTSAPQAATSELVLAPEHRATEEAIQASSLTWTFLRNGWYTENYLPTLTQARKTGTIIGSVGAGRVASASRKDYAKAAARVLSEAPQHQGKIYELSGDGAWNYETLAQVVSNLIERPVRYVDLSPEDHLAQLRSFGLDEGTAQFLVALDGNIRDGLLAVTTGELRQLIGRAPTPLHEGLAEALTSSS